MATPKDGEYRQKLMKLVKAIIVGQMGIPDDEITESASLVDDLGCDSLDGVELTMEFEESFEIAIADEDAEKMVTVKDVLDYLERAKVKV